MKVTTEPVPESQVLLQIEVEDDRLEKAMNSAYRRLASKTRIPGFRPGKAPRAMIERHLGEHSILHEAIDRLLPEVYREAIDQEQIDPIDTAGFELVTEQPLVVKFTVPVRPKVDLGDYASLRVPREPVVVEPERVQEGLEALRHRYATLEPATRPVQWGDVLRADVHGQAGDTVLVREEDAQFQLIEGRPISVPGFAEALIGREKGPAFEFEVTVPEEVPQEALGGQQATYRVEIKEVKQEVLPELDDEFARQVGEGFATLEALRSRVEDDLRQALDDEAKHRHEEAALDALAERAQLEYPPVIVEREVDRLLREQSGAKERSDLERYLSQAGRSEEEMRAELRPNAEQRVRRSLVLSQVAEAEHITATDEDVEAEVQRLASGAGSQVDEVRRLFSSDNAKESLRRSLVTRRSLERLTEIASAGETPVDASAAVGK